MWSKPDSENFRFPEKKAARLGKRERVAKHCFKILKEELLML